ncbi:MAG: hypothetical protein M1831_000458 [Alyxoria varia]|nr:MAG: hypothetical protein M1831_000458 [Alyxoria varia]
MTPSTESVGVPQASSDKITPDRVPKRRKLSAIGVIHVDAKVPGHGRTDHKAYKADSVATHETTDDDDSGGVPAHPLGIKPLGNVYDVGAPANVRTLAGGFAKLPDELLLHMLEYLPPGELLKLSATCRALHAFCAAEDIWKALAVNEAFNQKWANEPFILTEPVKKWPIYKQWSIDHLEKTYGDIVFRAEAVTWPLSTYFAYMWDSHDETPMYLFDRRFVEKMDLKVDAPPVEQERSKTEEQSSASDYTPPSCFHPDYFSVLGPHRPDSRWLILGPARSGSTFHKDPNGTSAWNAVIRGSKYWIMFPSTLPANGKHSAKDLPPPPGVYPSADGAHITTPFSIPEWLLNFHEAARATPGCREGICREGEVLHVPSGWFHLVLNLEPGVAVTQNFVPRAHLRNVLDFLREKREQVSGFAEDVKDPYGIFVNGLEREFPGLLAEVERGKESFGGSGQGKERTKWEEMTNVEDGTDEYMGGGFSFGFVGDDFED